MAQRQKFFIFFIDNNETRRYMFRETRIGQNVFMENRPNNKDICLRNAEAILLIQQRAKRERRSLSNSLAVTVIERLSSGFGTQDTSENDSSQTFLDTAKVK
jgi:hypothetical protein